MNSNQIDPVTQMPLRRYEQICADITVNERDWRIAQKLIKVVANMERTMIFRVMRNIYASAALLVVGLQGAFASSVNETDWQDHQGMISTRIVSVSPELQAAHKGKLRAEEGTILLAWEARLPDGWKTYWRSPGEAGLPVRLYQGDQDIDLYYPVPERFELFGLQTFGYSKSVMIPFEVQAKSGDVNFRADFMVCKDICVPFNASYQFDLEPETVGNIVADTRAKKWLADLPHIDGSSPGGLNITAATLAGLPGHQTLLVDVASDNPLNDADILVELDDATQFPSPIKQLKLDGRQARFAIPAVSARSGRNISGERLRLTLIDGRGNAVERFFDLPN